MKIEDSTRLVDISKSTAARILRSGKIDAAVTRVSARKFAINVDKALSLCPSNQ